jgi:hypothetical protein
MSAGALAVACGTDNGTTPLPGDKLDASTGGDDGSTGGNDQDGSTSGNVDGSTGGQDAGVTCKLPSLHEAGAGPYCPFQEGGTGDASAKFFGNCGAAEHCCDYQGANGGPPATCNAAASACGAPPAAYTIIDWACDTKSQCAGKECCMYGKDAGTTSLVTDNTCATGQLLKALNVGGTKCETACANGEVKLCADDSECTNGQHCTAFPTNAKQLGTCK